MPEPPISPEPAADTGNLSPRLPLLGLAFGLLVGVVEATAMVVLIAIVPAAINWRSANGPEILFIAPPVNAVVFAALGVLAWLGSLGFRRIPWDQVYVTVAGGFAGFLAAKMPGPVLYDYAVWAMTLGCAAVARLWYRSRRQWIGAHLGRITLALAAVPVLAYPVVEGFRWMRERRAIASIGPAPASRPNLLLLVLDTGRADHLGLYGYARPTSPVLDSLGAGGLVFAAARANSSWTLPSHATMMTGRQQHEHGAGLLRRPLLDGRWPTIAEALARGGYATGGFVANTFWTGRRTGLDRGFVHYSDYYRNPGDAIARTTVGRLIYYGILPRFRDTDIPGRRRAPQLNADLLDWIDGLHGRPFFAFVNYFDVHPPLLPPPATRGRFSSGAPPPTAGEIDIGALTGEMKMPPPEVIADRLNRYDESILAWDQALGDLLRALERRGLRRNTMIIVTSDHGESFGEHGLFSHGHSLYREQIDVPLVVSWPARITTPSRIDGPVGLDQLPATLLAAAGLPAADFPGRSLLGAEPSPGRVVTEVGRRSAASLGWPSSMGWVAGIVTRDWRFLTRQDGEVELYQESDSAERWNRAADPELPGLVDSFRREVERLGIPAGLGGR